MWKFALAIAAFLIAAWVCFLETPDQAFRLSIEVDTPEGVRSASGIFHVSFARSLGILPGVGGGVVLNGDAIFVDLGGGKNIVAILARGSRGLNYDGIGTIAFDAFSKVMPKLKLRDLGGYRDAVNLDERTMPTLVSFSDVTDPRSVRFVDYQSLAAEFGRGYAFRSASIEMVSPGVWPLNVVGLAGLKVTRGIDRNLPWVLNIKDTLFDRPACNPYVENCLHIGHFRRPRP